MKKRLSLIALLLSILMVAGGCGNKVNAKGYDVSKHIKLGKYKGVEVTVETEEVTDEDLENAIQDDLEANATENEITGRPVKNGDIVNIDFEGFKDGVAFEGGSATDFDLVIGSGKFIDGFEEQLIGANIGDEVELNVTFPENYTEPTLAGQPVVFKVKINAIKQSIVPELSEDYVVNNTDYESIDAYKEGIRNELMLQNQEEAESSKTNKIFTAIMEDTEIISYPDTLIEYYTNFVNEDMNYQASGYNMELEEFVSTYYQWTMDEYNEKLKEYAETMSAQEMVLQAIAEEEKITVSEEEYQEGIQKYLEMVGLTTEEELFQYMTEEEVRQNLLWEKVFDFITEQAVVS